MKGRAWLATVVTAIVVFTAACAATLPPVVEPSYTLNCDQPGENDPADVRGIAAGLAYGNPFHVRQVSDSTGIPIGEAPFRAILLREENNQTLVGPASAIVPYVFSNRLTPDGLASGKIIGKVWVDSAYVAGGGSDLSLPAGTSYIAACVPKRNGANGMPIKGLVIPATSGAVTQINGTYYSTRENAKFATAFWQSSSRSTMCISCGRGWCQF